MLPILTSIDLGFATTPGEHGYGGVRVQVLSHHLAVRAAEPTAAFHTVLLTRGRDEVPRFALDVRER